MELAPPRQAAQNYWLSSRYRHDHWMHDLSQHRDSIQRPGTSRRSLLWQAILPTIQEIMLSEPLTRILAYHGALLDELQIDKEHSALAASALTAHIEARHRCLHLIVFGQALSVEMAVSLNRLRRYLENFTDQLLATMRPIGHLERFAFDAQRVHDAQQRLADEGRRSTWTGLLCASIGEELWKSTRHEIDWRSASARLNYQVCQHVLSLLPRSFFDECGVPRSCRTGRIKRESPESAPSAHQRHPLFSCSQTLHTPFVRQPLKANPRRLD